MQVGKLVALRAWEVSFQVRSSVRLRDFKRRGRLPRRPRRDADSTKASGYSPVVVAAWMSAL